MHDLQPLRTDLNADPCRSGGVPARAVETGDQSRLHRIVSLLTLKTIGMLPVAAFAATVEDVLLVTMTFTCRAARSAAKAGNCFVSPFAQRYSISTFLP